MKLNPTLILLLLLILLPALFYSAYEINTLNEMEEMMTEIYTQQQNTMLYSVNQYAWDISNSWATRIESVIGTDPWDSGNEIRGFLDRVPGLNGVLLADTTLQKSQLFSKSSPPPTTETRLLTELQERKDLLSQLIHRKQVGYSKIESFSIDDDATGGSLLVLLYMAELPGGTYQVLAMTIDSQRFIMDILAPKLQEIGRTEFDLGIFEKNEAQPVYSVSTVEDTSGFLKRRIWLFPDHYLGVRMSGTSIHDIVRERFKRNLQLIILLDILLLVGAWLVFRNIRREVQLSRMKSDFVSNVSHELRTPLSLIRMFIETLDMGRVKTEEKKKEYYTIIGQETERLTHLINNILDFSRMEAGKKQYSREVVDINELVTHTLNMYEYHLRNRGFTYEKELAGETLRIKADPNAVTEALINLLENAMKYSEEKKYVAIRTRQENESVLIEVEDQGVGIPADQQKKIFDKFYRVSSGLTHNTKGSGLGLSIVRHIMDAHGGKITVSSQPGRGSRFQLRFPK